MSGLADQRARARIAYIAPAHRHDAALTELCVKAGYRIFTTTSAPNADIGLIDLRGVEATTSRAASIADAIRRSSPEAAMIFLVDAQANADELARIRRFGDAAPIAGGADHIIARIRDTIRIRNISEEAGERLKSLAAIHRCADFPTITPDSAPSRTLIIGDPGPVAIKAINAASAVSDTCICVLTAAQAMRALDHETFDVAVFLPGAGDTTLPTLMRAIRRHPKFGRTALLQVGAETDQLAAMARKAGASDFVLGSHVGEALGPRLIALTRRGRLLNAMYGFLRSRPRDGVVDMISQAFTPTFLAQHGSRLAARAEHADRPLSAIAVRMTHADTGRRETDRRAQQQAGRLLSRVLRAEDIISRIAPGLFLVLSPATSPLDALSMARRIEGVLANTAFRRGEAGEPQSLMIDVATTAHLAGAAFTETLAASLRALPGGSMTARTDAKQPQRQSPQ